MGAKAKLGAAQRAEAKATEGLGVKRMNDKQLVDRTKMSVTELKLLMNECDRRSIAVNFSIGKPVGALAGGFEVTRCDFTRTL